MKLAEKIEYRLFYGSKVTEKKLELELYESWSERN